MVVLNMQKKQGADDEANKSADLKEEVEYREKLLQITNRVNSANNIDEILIDLKDSVTNLFDAERLTVYVVDGINKELVSRVKSGNEINEIRVPISSASLTGYVASKGELSTLKMYTIKRNSHLLMLLCPLTEHGTRRVAFKPDRS